MSDGTPASFSPSVRAYLQEIRRLPLLGRDEELALARRWKFERDARAAHRLVTANLRFVVKVALSYRSYGMRMSDLIQEGNLGLMRAVERYDPAQGTRLISYAVWWIRAFIKSYILANWSLVRMGTTQAQRKLFYRLAKARREIERTTEGLGEEELARLLGRRLCVRPAEVAEMSQRLSARDLSLNVPVSEGESARHVDLLECSSPLADERLIERDSKAFLRARLEQALEELDPRERAIVESRYLAPVAPPLRELAQEFGFSRERARQLELRAIRKLRRALPDLARELLDLELPDEPVDEAPRPPPRRERKRRAAREVPAHARPPLDAEPPPRPRLPASDGGGARVVTLDLQPGQTG